MMIAVETEIEEIVPEIEEVEVVRNLLNPSTDVVTIFIFAITYKT
jgi:hypothetical protein